MLKRKIMVARGLEKADLVLKGGNVVNVFTMKTEKADVAICDGIICGIGNYDGIIEVDCSGKFISSGFMDAHIHIESSMMHPQNFSNAVIVHGTTVVMTDPHEIANVCGTDGINFMIDAAKKTLLDIYFLLPSCVPASPFDEGGAVLNAEELKPYYFMENVLGLAEMMDYEGTISADNSIIQKIEDAFGKIIDGHAPELSGKNLCAYLTAGIMSDHECTTYEEALERIGLGQTVMIREGSAAKNLESLIKLFESPYSEHCILCTDDKNPKDLINDGHINYILKKAVSLGASPITAIKMATLQTAKYFGLKNRGAVAPNYIADLVVIKDLINFEVEKVYKNGCLVAENKKLIGADEIVENSTIYNKINQSFNLGSLKEEDFLIKEPSDFNKKIRVISLIPGQITTKETIEDYEENTNGISVEKDILKLAVIERHSNTGHIGIGYIKGYGLKKGAIASSVSHDSHNLIVVGTNEKDMCIASNCVSKMQGGYAIACNGKIIDNIPLPIAGLMSYKEAKELSNSMENIVKTAVSLGVCEDIDPFMHMAFLSLPVIPDIRLTTLGLFKVKEQKIVSVFLEE